jgi:phosphopantetheinyl transferase (holo-ACP synthase)
MSRAFVGNDVVDLASPAVRLRAAADPSVSQRWRESHLTDSEQSGNASFWSLFACKEAAWKAFSQAGIAGAGDAFRAFEVDLGRFRVQHRPSGLCARIVRLRKGRSRVHCVVVFAGSELARSSELPISYAIVRVPADLDPGEAAREALVDLASAAFGGGRGRFAVAWKNGSPALLEAGRFLAASVSLSHSGRYAAASLLCA